MPGRARIPNVQVVLVGVDDYAAHDLAAGQTRGTSHLEGGVADALAWWSLLRRLGMPASAMRLLLGRVQGRRYDVGRPGARPRPATRANLRAALAAATASADARHPTLLVFAGRGGWHEDHGPQLCLEDSASLDDAVGVADRLGDVRARATRGRSWWWPTAASSPPGRASVCAIARWGRPGHRAPWRRRLARRAHVGALPPPEDWVVPGLGPAEAPTAPEPAEPEPPSEGSQLPIGTFGVYDDSGVRDANTRHGYVEVTANP